MESWKEEHSEVVRRTSFSLGTNRKREMQGLNGCMNKSCRRHSQGWKGQSATREGEKSEREKREDIEGIVKRGELKSGNVTLPRAFKSRP